MVVATLAMNIKSPVLSIVEKKNKLKCITKKNISCEGELKVDS